MGPRRLPARLHAPVPLQRLSTVALALILLLLASACAPSDDPEEGGRLDVVASFYPLAEAAERVGGDAVTATNLTPPGVEPHDLELSPEQVDSIATADLVLYVGRGFQPAVEEAVGAVAEGEAVDVLDGLPLVAPSDDGNGSATDPHAWLDPDLMAQIVSTVRTSLAELDPRRSSAFAANASSFAKELAALDRAYRTGLASCDRRLLVTSHAAFAYLAQAYGLEQVAIAGSSPEAEPSAEQIAELAERLRRDGVTTVFTESLVPEDLAETLAAEVGATTALLDPLEGLPQGEIDAGEGYGSVMRENLRALRSGLGCV